MSWHLAVHWLDDLRHFMAFTWSIWTWVGNISAGIVVGAVMTAFWPRLRRTFERWLSHHLTAHHSRLEEALKLRLDAHLEAVKAHISATQTPGAGSSAPP